MTGYKNPPEEAKWKPGQSGNPKGRPPGGLKDYDRRKFIAMSETEKEAFLKKISPELRYRMAEGNPEQKTDVTTDGEPIVLLPDRANDRKNNGNRKVAETE